MAYVTTMGICFACKRVFSFHPNKVPSYQGEPICKDCIDAANPKRIEKGLEPIKYAPDAYSECVSEEEINWE